MFAYAIQTSNPWPSLDRAMCYGQACAVEWFNALLRTEPPRRAYPAAAYAPAPPPAPVLRIDTSKLPVIPNAFWHAEQAIVQEIFQEEVRSCLAETHPHAFAESPFPTDKPTRKQRLGTWLDAHRGALKPWGRKKKQKLLPDTINPGWFRCEHCGEPTQEDLSYPSNKALESKLCGRCWLLQDDWVN